MSKEYYGTKKVVAWPEQKDGKDGYAITYPDGYQSWSPKDVFEGAYQESGKMNFGHAIFALKEGKKMARAGWNGKDMFVFLVAGSTFKVNRPPLLGIYPEGTEINYLPHVDIRTVDGKIVPWLASQVDMMADDWSVVP